MTHKWQPFVLVFCLLSIKFVAPSETFDSEEEKYEAFIDWLKTEHGATIGNIAIKQIPEYGRGVVATSAISVQSPLINTQTMG